MSQSRNFATDNANIVYYWTLVENSSSIANNTSNVTMTMWIKRTNSGYTTLGTGTVYYHVNGSYYTEPITTADTITSTPRQIFSRTFTVPHNADGTKTLVTTSSISHQRFKTPTNTFNIALTSLHLASSVPIVIAPTPKPNAPIINNFNMGSFTIGNIIPITIASTDVGYTHDLTLKIGDTIVATKNGVVTDGTMTLSLAEQNILYNAMYSASQATVTLYCITKNGATVIGSTVSSATAYVGSSIVPSFSSITASGVDSVIGKFVKNITPITFVINGAIGSNYSVVTGYNINFNSVNYPKSSCTTGLINKSGDIIATATITDSRGRTASQTLVVNLYDHIINAPQDNGYLIGETSIKTSNVVVKTYDGLQFNGEGILDNICVRNYVATISESIIISKPKWTADVLFLTSFYETTNSANVFGLVEPQTLWNLGRQEVGSSVVEKVAVLPPNVTSFIDYKTEGGKTYNYLISAQNDTQLSNPLISEAIATTYFGVYLIEANEDGETDNADIESYKFDLNCTVDNISNNADITTYRNYSKYDSYFIGDTDFLTGSVTSLLAYLDENEELQWSIEYLEKFRKFINNKKEKILKFKNGKAIKCMAFASNSESFSYQYIEGISNSGLIQPINVTFGFKETGKI